MALLLPIQAHALSLGGFQVDSALDEPLKAEIRLESVEDVSMDSLKVTLGSKEDFERAAVPRAEFLTGLEFKVAETTDGGAVVEVTSQQPIKEPFLHFLVSAEWRGGKLVREYTGLLDPPLYAGEEPMQVDAPQAGSGAVASENQPAATPATDTAGAGAGEASMTTDGGGAEYGPTREGDTLWNIASRLDTGRVQANVFQIMIALQRQNPDAFIDNNINRLRTGTVLRLRDLSAVAEISPQQASADYAAQLEQWQAQTTRVASAQTESETGDAAQQTGGSDTAEATDTAEAAVTGDMAASDQVTESGDQAAAQGQDDVLKIVQATVDESGESQAAGTGSDTSGEVTQMQNQIATLQESLESRTLENEELRERVNLLEGQLENAQRLIEIENQEMAEVQQQASASGTDTAQVTDQAMEPTTDQASSPESDSASMADSGSMAESGQTGSEGQTTDVAAQPVEPVEESGAESMASSADEDSSMASDEAQAPTETVAADDDSEPAAATPADEADDTQQVAAASGGSNASDTGTRTTRDTSNGGAGAWWSRIPDMLFSSWIWMVAAALGVLVLVLGLLMYMRRRQSIAEFEESILSGSALDSYSESTDSAANSASDTSFLSDFGNAGMGTMQADEVDPLAEAEVYLAYGRDEQAEEVLKEAARRDPQRAEVKLKLLEIYKQRNDVKSFETIAEELYPAADSDDRNVWRQVAAMGRELSPDNPLFHEAEPEGEDDDEGMGDLSASQDHAAASSGPANPAAGQTSSSLDFDMDETGMSPGERPGFSESDDERAAFGSDVDTPHQAQTPAPAQDDGSLDFDDDFFERPSGKVDPATQPFPAPDQQADLDRELDRLAAERERPAPSTATSGDAGRIDPLDTPQPPQEAGWERAEADDPGTLDFPTSDASDVEFDLNLDDDSVSQLTASDTTGTDSQPAPDQADNDLSLDTGADDDSLSLDEDGVLEFESEDLPPEERWASPSSDATPTTEGDVVSLQGNDEAGADDSGDYNEAETKLDLARAYLDMGDKIGARSIIDEVMREGDPAQRDQASQLASQL